MSLRAQVRQARKKLRMTQIDLAKAAKTTQGTISRIEKGKQININAKMALNLAKALNTTTEQLFEGQKSWEPRL